MAKAVSRVWLGGGAVVVVWCLAWTAVVATQRAAPVALAASFDFVVTASLALWWLGRGGVPRWMYGATVAIGLVFARLAVGSARGGGHAVLIVGGALELALVATVTMRFRRARRAYRTARTSGTGGFAALICALEATRVPNVLANAIATELYLLAMVLAGWRRPAPAFTVHRTNGFALYAGVIGFLIAVETPAAHLLIAQASGIAAWIATVASIYSLFWLVGYTHALRHGGLIATAESLELRIGVRWRGRIARSAIESIEPCGRAPAGALDCSVMGANTLVRLRTPARIYGLFGRTYEATAIALSVDDRDAFTSQTAAAATAAPRA